jgi:hypothetical protein
MDSYTDPKSQLFGVYSGWIFLACFAIGLSLVAPFVPPPSPSLSAEDIQALYQENQWRIILGCFITMMGAGFQVPLYVTLMCQMARMEIGIPYLGISQLAIGAYNCVFFIISPVIWVTIAFRPDVSAETMRMFNDFGWIIYLFITSPAIVANILIAICILRNQTKQFILPRWFAFVNIWVAIIFLPEVFMPYFKSGPFAWNGAIAFWLVILAFFMWFVALQYVLTKAVKQQPQRQPLT